VCSRKNFALIFIFIFTHMKLYCADYKLSKIEQVYHKNDSTYNSIIYSNYNLSHQNIPRPFFSNCIYVLYSIWSDLLCGLVVRVLDYRYRGPGFDSRALQKKVVGLKRGPLSLVSTTLEQLDRNVAAPV
jgi:hypothetical protein